MQPKEKPQMIKINIEWRSMRLASVLHVSPDATLEVLRPSIQKLWPTAKGIFLIISENYDPLLFSCTVGSIIYQKNLIFVELESEFTQKQYLWKMIQIEKEKMEKKMMQMEIELLKSKLECSELKNKLYLKLPQIHRRGEFEQEQIKQASNQNSCGYSISSERLPSFKKIESQTAAINRKKSFLNLSEKQGNICPRFQRSNKSSLKTNLDNKPQRKFLSKQKAFSTVAKETNESSRKQFTTYEAKTWYCYGCNGTKKLVKDIGLFVNNQIGVQSSLTNQKSLQQIISREIKIEDLELSPAVIKAFESLFAELSQGQLQQNLMTIAANIAEKYFCSIEVGMINFFAVNQHEKVAKFAENKTKLISILDLVKGQLGMEKAIQKFNLVEKDLTTMLRRLETDENIKEDEFFSTEMLQQVKEMSQNQEQTTPVSVEQKKFDFANYFSSLQRQSNCLSANYNSIKQKRLSQVELSQEYNKAIIISMLKESANMRESIDEKQSQHIQIADPFILRRELNDD